MSDHWVECSLGYWFDVVCLKVLLTAALGTSPPIPLKRQEAVDKVGFAVVLGGNRLDFSYVQDGVVLRFQNAGYHARGVDVWVPD